MEEHWISCTAETEEPESVFQDLCLSRLWRAGEVQVRLSPDPPRLSAGHQLMTFGDASPRHEVFSVSTLSILRWQSGGFVICEQSPQRQKHEWNLSGVKIKTLYNEATNFNFKTMQNIDFLGTWKQTWLNYSHRDKLDISEEKKKRCILLDTEEAFTTWRLGLGLPVGVTHIFLMLTFLPGVAGWSALSSGLGIHSFSVALPPLPLSSHDHHASPRTRTVTVLKNLLKGSLFHNVISCMSVS